jgi:RND family efflux transporter MFP subunit
MYRRKDTAVNTPLAGAFVSVLIAAPLCACTQNKPTAEAPRTVRTVELRYDKVQETDRYVGTVQARHEVDQAFRVGGKIVRRRVDVGQVVREDDVLAVLDDTDYRLAEEAARQEVLAAETRAHQADSDQRRFNELKSDGSVSPSDDEHAQSGAQTAQATAEAEARKLDLAANRLKYTVLRASQSGVVTAVRFEVGQVVAEGQPIVAIANQGEPEIVVDVPEDQLAAFNTAKYKAYLESVPGETFEVALRELSPQAAAQTRTYRARLKPVSARRLPLGATATLIVQQAAPESQVAAIPATAITQSNGQPALWVVRHARAEPVGTVELMRVTVHAYRTDEVLVSGPPAGELVVTAGVQKMAPGLRVALASSRSQNTINQTTR